MPMRRAQTVTVEIVLQKEHCATAAGDTKVPACFQSWCDIDKGSSRSVLVIYDCRSILLAYDESWYGKRDVLE